MVFTCAIALGSSTYAWFANNNKVDATGLNIKAKTEGTLLMISDNANFTADGNAVSSTNPEVRNTSIELSTTAAELYPTHNIVGTIASEGKGKGLYAADGWKHAYSNAFTTAVTTDVEETLTMTEETVSGKAVVGLYRNTADAAKKTWEQNIYLKDQLWIKVDQTGAPDPANGYKHLYANVIIENADPTKVAKLMDAARVMLVIDGKNAYTFCTNGGTTGYYMDKHADAIQLTTVDDVTTYSANQSKLALSLIPGETSAKGLEILSGSGRTTAGVAGTAIQVDVYVFFDGRDPECTSENYDANGIKVTLEFTGTNAE